MARAIFSKIKEMQHGQAAYDMYRVAIEKNDFPDLDGLLWQDIAAWGNDDSLLALCAWAIEYSVVGFRIYILDLKSKTFKVSKRILGHCQSLDWEDTRVKWSSSQNLSGFF